MRVPDPLLTRIRGEYLEMPGLRLTPSQASRLWQLDRATCEAALARLVEDGFLVRTRDDAFVMVADSGSFEPTVVSARVRRTA